MSNLEILKPVANEERANSTHLTKSAGTLTRAKRGKTKPVQFARENSTRVKRMEFGLLSIDDLGLCFNSIEIWR